MSSFFKKLAGLFKKLFALIKKILAIILIVIAVILIIWACLVTGGAALVVFGFAISQTMAIVLACVAITGAFLIDPKTSKQVVGKIGDAAGEAAEAVAGAVGKVTGSGVKGVIEGLLGSNGMYILAGGLALWFFMSNNDDDEEVVVPSSARMGTVKPAGSVPALIDKKKEAASVATSNTYRPGQSLSGKSAILEA